MSKLLMIFTLFFSLVLVAAPVSNDELKSVNDYISERINSNSPVEGLSVKVSSANYDSKTNLINKMVTNVNFADMAFGSLGLFINKTIVVNLSGQLLVKDLLDTFLGNMSEEEYNEQISDLKMMIIEMRTKIDEIAKTDLDLNVATELTDSATGFGVTLAIFPKLGNSAADFNSLSFSFNYDYANKKINYGFGFDGLADVKTLSVAQNSLSNIFSSLVSKNEPAEEDFDALFDALSSSYDKVSDQLDKYTSEIF